MKVYFTGNVENGMGLFPTTTPVILFNAGGAFV